ncbi:MAG: hypothetical protein N4A65_00460 [Cohaesibacter sp.]|jgi:hypothetical protein|nr:hypothetical protein [Cohaesibacter sp.]
MFKYSFAVFLFLCSPSVAFTDLIHNYPVQARNQLLSYFQCANKFLTDMGTLQPHAYFDDIEPSLPVQCGEYIKAATFTLKNAGLSPQMTKDKINAEYKNQRPSLVRRFYHSQAKALTLTTPNAPQNTKNTDIELAKDKANECFAKHAIDIMAYSDEKAEIGAEVVLTRCEVELNGVADAIFAQANRPKNELEAEVKTYYEDRHRKIISSIVTGRVTLRKGMLEEEQENSKPPNKL